MKTVIKAQRSIPDGRKVLIYNRSRTLHQELPCDGALATAIGDRYKCYFEVVIDDDGLMHIQREVKAAW